MKKDKYNRKVLFGVFFIISMPGIYFTINQIKAHEHFFLTLMTYLITAYSILTCFTLLKVFMHGVPCKLFDEALIEAFNVRNNDTPIISNEFDRVIYVELRSLIKDGELYYIYDYARVIKVFYDKSYKKQKINNDKITIKVILNTLKKINCSCKESLNS